MKQAVNYNQKEYPLYNPSLIRMSMGSSDFIVNYIDMLDESCVEFQHIHEDGYEIYYCIDGTHHLMIEDECYTLVEGDFLLLRPGVFHNTLYEPKSPKHYAVFVFNHVESSSPKSKGRSAGDEDSFVVDTLKYFENNNAFFGHAGDACRELLGRLQSEIENSMPGRDLMISALYQQYLISVLRCMHSHSSMKNTVHPASSKINLAIEMTKYMHANYNKNISVQDISDTFYLSPRHVNRVFSDYFGQSFKRTLNIYRLNYAKNYLMDTDLSVEKIAELVGLSSTKMLYQLFQEVEGISLAEFRAKYT